MNLANSFIQSFKSFGCILILFNQKFNKNLYFYMDYWNLNNLTPKISYLLSFISKLLDLFSQAKRFTLLNLIYTYYLIKINKDNK